jgi:(p)ppGpp synthase/HD superfamily hydrolase
MINREKFLAYATQKHQGQVRKGNGEPYINHPKRVAVLAEQNLDTALAFLNKHHGTIVDEGLLKTSYDIAYCVAIGHDLLEDTDCTEESLINVLNSLEVNATGDETLQIVKSIKLLTKPETNFDILTYLNGILSDAFATIVKKSDLKDNMSDLKPGNLLDKYKLCEFYLTNFYGKK